MAELPIDGSVEAEYEDGYIHREDAQDHSPFVSGKNIFDDILHRRPETGHGKMVRFTVFYKDHRYDINWTGLPDNARPIRYKNMEMDKDGPEANIRRMVSIGFGYQYIDENGENKQEIKEL